MLRHGPIYLLKYLAGTRARVGGSAANLVQHYLELDNASRHVANVPSSQRYFYEKGKDDHDGLSQRQKMIQLRLGAAQMLAPSQHQIGNHNNAHPLYYAQTSPREAGLCVPLVIALRNLKIRQLTELQGALIPLILKGKHVIAHSETGTGKSFAIALAIANRIIRGGINYRLHTIILVPTEELTLQYDKWFRHFGGCTSQVVQAAIDSIPLEAQLARLHNVQPHVLVGTPQRIADINRHSPTTIGEKLRRKVDCVVLDEADLILSTPVNYGRQRLSGANIVDRIFRSQPDEVPAQLIAASATVDGATAQLLNTWTRNDKAVRLTTSFVEHSIPPTISFYFFSETRAYPLCKGLELILRLICRQVDLPRILLFTEEEQVMPLCRMLVEQLQPNIPEAEQFLKGGRSNRERFFAAPLCSTLPQTQDDGTSVHTRGQNPLENGVSPGASSSPRRSQLIAQARHVYVKDSSTLSKLNEGDLLIGVSSFAISRGLHVDGVTHVILYGSCPPATQFVHCAGRTGRMGAEGDVIVLFPPSSGRTVQQVCHSLDLSFKPGKLETVADMLSSDDFSTAGSLKTLSDENEYLAAEIRKKKLKYLHEDTSLLPSPS
ncbi:unnamed protein product [Phytomonas sp. EM1]|nr:unnamed protein product [Phytomonas sp. EM1]|eukprot:CCW60451.1 unnamed protein product [Phytomonas sp. isolate EM1]